MTDAAPLWTDGMRAAWRWPERMRPSEWCEAHSLIVSKDAAEPGPWRFARTPHMREIVDAIGAQDRVQEIVMMFGARCGKTEGLRRMIAYTIALEPSPVMIVFPDEDSAKRQVSQEIAPMIERTPALAQYLSGAAHDLTKGAIRLATMNLYPAWAGSAQTTAEKTIRVVLIDETDKFRDYAGRDAGAVATAPRRTETFKHRRKVVFSSTPTGPDGPIARLAKSAVDRRHWHLPCPRCGEFQRLAFASLKWAKREGESRLQTAERLETTGGVWCECPGCKGRIDEREMVAMSQRGRWQSEGFAPGEHPDAIRRAYHFSQVTSLLGRGWSSIVAQFLRAVQAKDEGDLTPLVEWTNQVLGEVFEMVDREVAIKDATFAAKAARGHPPRVAPKWTASLVCTVDTQRDGFYWLVRAWGAGERSRLIDRGRAATFEELERLTISGPGYPIDGWPAERVVPARMYIDSGGGSSGEDGDRSLTDRVYSFARTRPGRVQPLKGWGGHSGPTAPIQLRRVEYRPEGRTPFDVQLLMIDTQHFKDVLAALAQPAADGAVERWEVCSDVDQEYVLNMTSERRVAKRQGGGHVLVWERIAGRPNHYFDLEVYQLAAARHEQIGARAAPEDTLERARHARSQPRDEDEPRRYEASRSPWWTGVRT